MGNQYVTIEFYDPTIVRVVKASNEQADATTHTKSYSVIMKPQRVKSVGVREDGDVVTMESPQMTVSLNQKTGEIRFLSKEGKPLLTDTQTQLEARQATMFPKWTLDFWPCRERYKTSDELAGV